jgi:sugar lactone lactonase YvrE
MPAQPSPFLDQGTAPARFRRWWSRWSLAGLLALLTALGACGGGGTPPPPPATEGSATLGADGGVVSGPDGTRLALPAGAVSTGTTFRIARDDAGAPDSAGVVLLSPVYAITPHGSAFEGAARVRVPYDTARQAPGTRPVLIKVSPGGNWTVLQDAQDTGGALEADVNELSWFAVGACSASGDQPGAPGTIPPQVYCPADTRLTMVLKDANGTEMPVPRDSAGFVLPVTTIEQATPIQLELRWQRPATMTGTDLVGLTVLNGGLIGSAMRVLDAYPVTGSATIPVTVTIDPQRVPQGLRGEAGVVRFKAAVVRDVPVWSFRCFCIIQGQWWHQVELVILAKRPPAAPQPPVITAQPVNANVSEGQTARFAVTATGEALSYQWSRWSGQTQTEIADSEGSGALTAAHVTPPTTPDMNGRLYGVRVCSRAGTPQQACVNSDAVQLSVAARTEAPVFTLAPQALTVTEGETASFTATATGRPAPELSWGKFRSLTGGVLLTDPVCGLTAGSGSTTSATCTIGPVSLADDGARYVARAANGAGVVTSPLVRLTVLPRPVPPTITSPGELRDRSITAGDSVSWTLEATGTAPLSWSWFTQMPGEARVSGIRCAGGDSPAWSVSGGLITLTRVPESCNGLRLEGVVSNAQGSANPTARIATLTVNPAPAAPRVTLPLADRSVLDGQIASWTVAATGTPATFTYDWTLGGAPVADPLDGCTRSLPRCAFTARLADSGRTLRVVVGNGVAPDAVSSAVMTVVTNDVAAFVRTQPADAATVEGGSARFEVGAGGTPTPTVQWQTSADGLTWRDAGSGTRLDLTGLTLAQNGSRWRAVLSNTIATVNGPAPQQAVSREAVLTVAPTPAGMAWRAGRFETGAIAGGSADQARFDAPRGLVADADGRLYVASSNQRGISRVDRDGTTTVLLSGLPITGDNQFAHLALGADGRLWIGALGYGGLFVMSAPVSPTSNLRQVSAPNSTGATTQGGLALGVGDLPWLTQVEAHAVVTIGGADTLTPTMSVVAGGPDRFASAGSADGTGVAARFRQPGGIARAPDGSFYVADTENHTIRRVTTTGEVSTFAGSAGQRGSTDATGAAARFNRPLHLAVDPAGNLWVVQAGSVEDGFAVRLRKVTPAGVVSTPFDPLAEARALPQAANVQAAIHSINGITALNDRQLAMSIGNAVVVRTLP